MENRVVTVTVEGNVGSAYFKEHEFPTLNKYLEQGYGVSQVHQIQCGTGAKEYIILTFILSK